MNKEKLVDKLLDYFIHENDMFLDCDAPANYEEKRKVLRGIINLRLPEKINDEILKLEDELLKLELKEKKTTDAKDINLVEKGIALWQGDITTLKADAIVNAANSAMLGCFIPNHSCIDNQIHTSSGIRLRLYCNDLMNEKEAKTGEAIITPAFNLPSKYVIHTVGPIINCKVTEKDKQTLASCYTSCLDLARKNNVKTIAFPCISTGVFAFPKEEACKIAVSTVRDYLKKYPDAFDKVIFNVFSKEDKTYYERYLKNKKNN